MEKQTNCRYQLAFMSDETFRFVLEDTMKTMRRSITYKQFIRPVADALKLEIYSAVYDLSDRETVQNEVLRQLEKTNNNAIGYFHQKMFCFAGGDWSVPANGEGGGFDLINTRRHIYVEIKNGLHHNSNEMAGLWLRMTRMVDMDPLAQCYLVEALSDARGVRPFHFAPRSQARQSLNGLGDNVTPDDVLHMGDLLGAFNDEELDNSIFYDAFEHRYDDPDEEETCDYGLAGTEQLDTEQLSEQERNYLRHIHRASIDWLYKLVFGRREYFYDMLEAVPLALDDITADTQIDSAPQDSVAQEMRLMGIDLDSDQRQLYWHLLGVIYTEMRRRHRGH